MDVNKEWQKCIDFHGHECKGLLIGFLASIYASEILGLTREKDEENVCISECDACPVDAIQVMLGCTLGRGNLLFHMTGKTAFSFYSRKTGRSVRLVLKDGVPDFVDDMAEYCASYPHSALFEAKDAKISVPERARIFRSYICDECGEKAGDMWMRMQDGKRLCLDCAAKYDRFRV